MLNLFKEKGKQLPIKDQRYYKGKIRVFFNGSRIGDEPIIENVSIERLGITNITFLKFKKYLEITIALERPGLLIGYHGKTINKLTNYLSVGEEIVKINIVESKLWK